MGYQKIKMLRYKVFSGYTTEDTLDIAKTAAERKPDATIIHAGTNDITREINTMKNIRKIVK